jgi:hypothetical protein
LNEFGLGSIDEVYAAGKIERLFGPVFALMENGVNNPSRSTVRQRGYVDHRMDVIYLAGLPDIPESRRIQR